MEIYGSTPGQNYVWFEIEQSKKVPEIDLLNLDMANLPTINRDDSWMKKACFVKVY